MQEGKFYLQSKNQAFNDGLHLHTGQCGGNMT